MMDVVRMHVMTDVIGMHNDGGFGMWGDSQLARMHSYNEFSQDA